MAERAPIPPAEFAAAVDRLDRAALAGFVGRLEAATAGSVDTDIEIDTDTRPAVVERTDDAVRRRVAVVPDTTDFGGDPHREDDLDAVVVGTADSPDGIGADTDVEILTPADLRRRLLYALAPETAESVAKEWLDVPARAASYASTAGTDADSPETDPSAESFGPDSDVAPVPGGRETQTEGTADPGTTGGSGEADATSAAAGSGSEPTRSTLGGWSVAQAAVVAVLLAILFGGAGGVVYAAELSPDGDAGAFVAAEPGNDTARETPAPTVGDRGAVPSAAGAEANRNVRSVPTCTRSPLQVVQIQMNALKYNNDTTNDGIRTVRRFASPGNREAIATFEQFVRTIESPAYSPMLSYDSAQYTPIRVDDDDAQVQVVTRENGSVTGQYYFRQRKIDEGRYEGCWMTDGVVTTQRTGVVADGDVSHPEGRPSADYA